MNAPPPRAPAVEAGGAARPTFAVIALLGAITALGPFSMQAIAPGLPTLSASLSISEAAAQMMISLPMLTMALGAIVYGPLADHYGRRPVLLWSLVLATLGAVLTMLAPLYEIALVGRMAQAIGSGAGMVLARAAARDLFGAEGSAEAIAKITALMVAAPMVAPAIGGALTELFGWRGVFGAIALVSLLLVLVVLRRFAETAPTLSPTLKLGTAASDFREIVTQRAFLANAAYVAGSLASFFLFVSAGPYVMQRAYEIGPAAYGALFAAGALVYMGANLASPRVTRRFGAQRTILLGALIATLGCAGVAALLWLRGGPDAGEGADWVGAIALLLACSANAVGGGLATPNAMAGGIGANPMRAGSASALISVAQFGAGAVAAQAASWLPFSAGWPLAAAMAGCSAVALIAYCALSGVNYVEKAARR